MPDPKTRPQSDTDERAGVEGGEREAGADVQSTPAAPPAGGEGGLKGEEHRDGSRGGGMIGEG